MADRGLAFGAIRRLVRAIPDGLPGKTRVARIALRPFLNSRWRQIPDRFGNRLWVPSLSEPIALSLFGFGVYEPETLSTVLSFLSSSGVFLDVGANIGAIAIPVAACRPDAYVLCVEADPEIAKVLRRNVNENNLINIKIIEGLAGDIDDCQVPFYRAPIEKFGMGSVGPQFHSSTVMLSQHTLDRLLDDMQIDSVAVVKLDVEGGELRALLGLSRRLSGPQPPVVVFEFTDWAETRIQGQAAGGAQELLLSLGYRLSLLAGGGYIRLDRPLIVGYGMILALPRAA